MNRLLQLELFHWMFITGMFITALTIHVCILEGAQSLISFTVSNLYHVVLSKPSDPRCMR